MPYSTEPEICPPTAIITIVLHSKSFHSIVLFPDINGEVPSRRGCYGLTRFAGLMQQQQQQTETRVSELTTHRAVNYEVDWVTDQDAQIDDETEQLPVFSLHQLRAESMLADEGH